MSKAWEVFRFELAYQCSRVSTRIYFAIFLALSLMMTFIFINDARNDGYFFNAPIITAAVTIINSLFALLVVAAVGGDAATRDHETRLDSLLYTTPIGKAAYLGGRFAGAFAVTALLLLAVPIALLATTALPSLEPELIGPFRADAYLIAYFFFAVPNALICTAIIFSLAAVTRSTVAGYAGAAFLFFASFFSEGFFGGNLGQWALGRLADPLGFTTLISIWRTYNPLQKNTLPVPIDGILLGNRLLWLGVALSALAIAMARFRFAYVGGSNSRFAPHPSPLPAERGEG